MADYEQHPFVRGVPHYYGDIVRQLFICVAALMLVAAPFYADALRVELPFEIVGALTLVAVAALVNPNTKATLFASAVASGVGAVVYETWALYGYMDSSWSQFLLRQFLAVLFLLGFYFSVKTVRAFLMHTIGVADATGEPPGEFSAGTRSMHYDHERTKHMSEKG